MTNLSAAVQARLNEWLACPLVDEDTKNELRAAEDPADMEDRFYRGLSFGTGGLRGVMGAGTNRMNLYTVGAACAALARFLADNSDDSARRGVAIAWDTRNRSAAFARHAARVLNGYGFATYLFGRPVPTPMLSFAVRRLGCAGGIVITASHNPKEYNGYKVYDAEGCQITEAAAAGIADLMAGISPLDDFPRTGAALNRPVPDSLPDEFVTAVLGCGFGAHLPAAAKAALKIVYTPLHGTGLAPVQGALERDGFAVDLVKAQSVPDGDFPTVKSPNPEERTALEMGVRQAKEGGADIVLGTDPDCDRIGAAVLHRGEYRLLSGNQLGALLLDYVISKRRALGTLPADGVAVKTVVTGGPGASIARAGGLRVAETLTGFKYIGEQMNRMEADGSGSFVFGYEESFGYLIGGYARDKDAVGAAVLLCEMCAEYKAAGHTLPDRLEQLYGLHGRYIDALDSFTLEGRDGAARIAALMRALRRDPSVAGGTPRRVEDFLSGDTGLPRSDVLKLHFDGGTWLAARPSGTEPKIKFYYSVAAPSEAVGEERLKTYRLAVRRLAESIQAGM